MHQLAARNPLIHRKDSDIMSNLDIDSVGEEAFDRGQRLLNHLEAEYTPADAYFACVVALAILTMAMEVPLHVTLEGVEAAFNDLTVVRSGGNHGAH